ncbi:hypothetical protein FKM82_014836 [Ascaphus truei]
MFGGGTPLCVSIIMAVVVPSLGRFHVCRCLCNISTMSLVYFYMTATVVYLCIWERSCYSPKKILREALFLSLYQPRSK